MSGNEPNWNEDEENAGDLYGAPTGTPRPGDESTEPLEPMDFVQPLSLDDVDSDGDDGEPLLVDESASERVHKASASSGGLRLAGDDDEDESLVGNRPAEGARVVSASEIFSEDFMGAEGASDFLGLDTDFDPTPVAGHASGGLDVREPLLDTAGSGELEVDDHAIATEESEERYASPISAPESDPQYATEYAEAYDGEDAGEFAEDQGDDVPTDEELFGDDVPAPKRRRGLLVGVALAFGLAAVAAYTYYPQLTGGGKAPLEVASTGGGKSAPAAGGAKTDPAGPAAQGPMVGGEGPAVEPVDEASTDPSVDPIEITDVSDPLDADPYDGDPPADDPLVDVDPADATTPDVEPSAADTIDATPVKPDQHSVLLAQLLAEARELERMRGGSPSMIDLVWRGETVPIEAIGSTMRVLTPAVGPVRVHMASLDVFDGHLFAVGENKVWLDLEPGRIGLDGSAVAKIDRLPREAGVAGPDPKDLVTGDRVRARVPGGVIYGRVRSKTDTGVTLVTDSGARITLENPVLESVGDAKSVVLKL